MTEETRPKTDTLRPPDSRVQGAGSPSGGHSTSPSPGSPPGDPERRAFDDQTDDASRRSDPSRAHDRSRKDDVSRPGSQTDEDGGEHDKGPRVDVTTASSDALQGDRSKPSQQQNKARPQNPTTPQSIVHGKSGSDCSTPAKEPEVKPTRTLSDGRPV